MGHIPVHEMETSLTLHQFMVLHQSILLHLKTTEEIERENHFPISYYTKNGGISDKERNPWEEEEMHSMSSTVEYENIEDDHIIENNTDEKEMKSTRCKKKRKKNESKIQLESFEFIESLQDRKETKKKKLKRSRGRDKSHLERSIQTPELMVADNRTIDEKSKKKKSKRKNPRKQSHTEISIQAPGVMVTSTRTSGNGNRAKCKTKSRFSYSLIKRLQDRTLRLGKQECSIGQRFAIFGILLFYSFLKSWRVVIIKCFKSKTTSKHSGPYSVNIALRRFEGHCCRSLQIKSKWSRSLPATLYKKVFKILSLDCPIPSRHETQSFDVRPNSKKSAEDIPFTESCIERNNEKQCKFEEQTRKHRKIKDNCSKRQRILKDIFPFIIIRLLKEVLEGNWIVHIVLICTLFETTIAMYCPESMKTLSPVKACPLNEKDWLSASEKMKCESKIQTCCPEEDYKYHCLVNVFQNETFELCAPKIKLNYCPQYNDYGARVQINFHANCTNTSTDCGKFYDSNKAYEMPNCLKLNLEEKNGIPDGKTPHNEISITSKTKDLSGSNFIGLFIGITTGIIMIMLMLIFLWRIGFLKRNVCHLIKCKDSGQRHMPPMNDEADAMINDTGIINKELI